MFIFVPPVLVIVQDVVNVGLKMNDSRHSYFLNKVCNLAKMITLFKKTVGAETPQTGAMLGRHRRLLPLTWKPALTLRQMTKF